MTPEAPHIQVRTLAASGDAFFGDSFSLWNTNYYEF